MHSLRDLAEKRPFRIVSVPPSASYRHTQSRRQKVRFVSLNVHSKNQYYDRIAERSLIVWSQKWSHLSVILMSASLWLLCLFCGGYSALSSLCHIFVILRLATSYQEVQPQCASVKWFQTSEHWFLTAACIEALSSVRAWILFLL